MGNFSILAVNHTGITVSDMDEAIRFFRDGLGGSCTEPLLYAQPFITSGDYSGLKYLARPATYEFVSMGTDGSSDFNYRSVRGNAVLRWEYLPGSTFFLVWTQQREDVVDDGRFHLNASLASLGHADAANTILVKVAHHFTM